MSMVITCLDFRENTVNDFENIAGIVNEMVNRCQMWRRCKEKKDTLGNNGLLSLVGQYSE